MHSINQLIRKVSKYVTFGRPISSGSVISQRISDPRIPIQAYYLAIQSKNEQENYYHEVWLKKEGTFAITEAWYTNENNIIRQLLKDNLSYEQLKAAIGDDQIHSIMLRITEIIKKSENDVWKPLSSRS